MHLELLLPLLEPIPKNFTAWVPTAAGFDVLPTARFVNREQYFFCRDMS